MIQFNLLPDIKLEYIKAQRTKRSVILISLIVSGSCVALLILLFITVASLNRHSTNLSNDISARQSELEGFEELDKVLTIQNQLNSINGLHDQKPVVTRFYSYLPQLVPAKTPDGKFADLSNVDVSFEESTISFEGTADSIATINKFVDTLKFTTFTQSDKDGKPIETDVDAFSNVVLSGFTTGQAGVTYTINLNFDPLIFDSEYAIALKVPQIITTRSETEKPSEDLFKPNTQEGTEQ